MYILRLLIYLLVWHASLIFSLSVTNSLQHFISFTVAGGSTGISVAAMFITMTKTKMVLVVFLGILNIPGDVTLQRLMNRARYAPRCCKISS